VFAPKCSCLVLRGRARFNTARKKGKKTGAGKPFCSPALIRATLHGEVLSNEPLAALEEAPAVR